ncbi:hypothetical protein T459_26884 [Capsicum annuum]|uniref:AP2/ERF domain-containing protein n=1 Tax=Capsicum annuum TaxID=4072 RepID=A0A2G2YCB2_CAPAN|nr:hypothetical protein T459_26884 [Capsicum annuum]
MVRKRKCGKLGTEEKLKVAIFAKSENGSSGDLPLMADSQTSDSLKSKKFTTESEEELKVAKNAKVKRAISAKSEIGSSSSEVKIQSLSLINRKSLSFDQVSGKLPPMVRKRKSGKFATEIRDPFSKKRIWLGIFNTAVEASENTVNAKEEKAISAKFGLEFCSSDSQTSDSSNELDDLSKKAEHAIVKKAISAKFGLEFCSSDTQTSDSSNELDDRSKNAENAIVKEAISAKFELGNSSSDPSSTVDSQTSDSSNDQESEEELWMGQWIRISGDKEVKFSQKLGVPVVDNYGFLLGEFSKLDDLSISL